MALVPAFLLALFFSMSVGGNAHESKVPAIYVFGDSTADVGNNNYLGHDNVNYHPYGIDFPNSRPTGRYCNGYNVIDFLARHMGFLSSPPAFLSLNGTSQEGVNFASGASGILDSTGNYTVINMAQQIKYFENIIQDIPDDVLSKSIFIISAGSNDLFAYIKNYTIPTNATKEQFYNDLISNYTQQIEALYNLGARKFGIIALPPVGCCPLLRLWPFRFCNVAANSLAGDVNDGYKVMLSNLSSTLTGMTYSLANSYAVISDLMANPEKFGYKDVKNACCQLGSSVTCRPNSTDYCWNRNQYLFWDGIHGTSKTYKKESLAIYTDPQYASPITFEQLVEDDIDGTQDAFEKASLAIYSDPQYASDS